MNLMNKGAMGLRVPPFVSAEWRKSARGQNCTLMLPGCRNDTATTVLCHLRMFGWAGAAQKPHDFLAVYACGHCHDLLDRRGTKAAVDPWEILRALGQTLITHYEEGRAWK